jgi:transcriptional regulator with XRE-family HTH domain
LSSEFYGDVDTYINDHYVEQKEKEEYDSAAFNRENRKSRGIGSFFQKVKDFAAPIDDDDEYEYYEDVEMPSVVLRPQESLDDVLNNRHKTFMEMVFTFADERGLSDVDVQKRANLDRKAFSKLKCGTTKNPSKNTALAIAVALELDLDETKDLLSRAGLALSPVNRQDLIVRYYIEHGNYNIYRINEALFEHNEKTLGMQIF